MEIWDLYTADGQLSGQTIRRGEKIPQGYYHLVSEVLVRHRDGCYLLMRRAASKKIYPGCWEATAGGSVLAGETALEGARRELREETGIENAELTPMGCQVCDLTGSIYHSFLAVTDWGRDSVKLQPGETEGFRWFSEKEFREFWRTGNPVPIQKRRLLPWLKEMGYVDPGEQVPLTAPELVDLGICPTCYDRSHNFALYGDPAEITLYENDRFSCVLVGAPRAPGHCAIISREHFKDMSELPDDLCAAVCLFAKKAMNAIKVVYGTESVYLCTMCDGPMNHFHLQLIPRYGYEKRGSGNFVKPRQAYIHDPEKIRQLRAILRTDI